MPTATVTGPVRDQTGGNPLDATIEFRLREAPRNTTTAVAKGSTIAPVTGDAFAAVLYFAPGIPTVYDAILHYRPFLGAEMIKEDIGPIILSDVGTFPIASLIPVKIPPGASDSATFKNGDTIELAGIWMDEFNRPADHTGVTISANLRGPDAVDRAMTVAKLSPAANGEFTVSMAADQTAALPVGVHFIDIKFATAESVRRTITSKIIIEQRITP